MLATESRTESSAPSKRLRVLTTRHYVMPANLPKGSRHELIEEKFFDPWRRVLDWTEGIAVWDPRLKFDLVHSYNKIPFTSKPWLVSFEDQLPRLFGKNPLGMKERLRNQLLKPNCRGILPMSDYARNMFRLHHQDWSRLDEALAKTQVVYPNVPVLAEAPKSFDGGTLHLAFVGNDFARKGGVVCLRVAKYAQEKGLPVHVHVASSLRVGSAGYFDSEEPGVYDADLQLLELPNVTHHGSLKSSAVMELLDRSHFHALPTLDDSFGLSVIESLSTATPVIASNVCAMPEMVQDGVNGYGLQVPIDEYRKWVGVRNRSWKQIDEACQSLTEQMIQRIEALFNAPESYRAMSEAALTAAREKFSSEVRRDFMDDLYSRSV